MNPDPEMSSDARAHNFGAREIAMKPVASASESFEGAYADLGAALRAAMKASERVQESIWPQAWHDNAGRVISPAYRLFRIMKAGGPGAARMVADALPERKRKAKLSNPAHLAMMLTLKPEAEAERKTCSDYASVLIVLDQHDVDPDPEKVVAALAETTLEECLKSVRTARRESRAARRKLDGNLGAPVRELPRDELSAPVPCEPEPATRTVTVAASMEAGTNTNTILPNQDGPVPIESGLAIEITISGYETAAVVRVPIRSETASSWNNALIRLRQQAPKEALEHLWCACTPTAGKPRL